MKKLKVLCDPIIGIECMIGFPILIAMVPFVMYMGVYRAWHGEFGGLSPLNIALVFILFGALPVAFLIGVFWMFPPLMAYVELDEEGMQLKQPFKFKKYSKIPYSKLNFFRLGFYNHGGHIRFFLVMSQYAVSQDELMRINRVQNSDTLVKINLTKKNYKRLCEILPEDRRNMLERAMNGNGKDGMFDAAAYAKRKAKQEKLKKKKRRKRKQ